MSTPEHAASRRSPPEHPQGVGRIRNATEVATVTLGAKKHVGRPGVFLVSAWRAVFWGFLGVRKGRDLEHDAGTIRLVQVVAAGLLGAALLVLALLGLVHLVTR